MIHFIQCNPSLQTLRDPLLIRKEVIYTLKAGLSLCTHLRWSAGSQWRFYLWRCDT